LNEEIQQLYRNVKERHIDTHKTRTFPIPPTLSHVLILGAPGVVSQLRNDELSFIFLEELCLFREIGNAKVQAEGEQASGGTLQYEDYM
jgi:hypothetical protein